jgi:XRE family aerobic/anaerobic benzoate catabolism transcriptional regulator
VWLRASPDDHWDRVVEQGDTRPMRGVSDAKDQLQRLLEERMPFYGMADVAIDTTLQSPTDLADELARRLGPPAEGR